MNDVRSVRPSVSLAAPGAAFREGEPVPLVPAADAPDARTVVDLKRLFRDLAARGRNDLDNGMVDGHVSLADRAAFAEKKANAEKLRGD